MAQPPGEQLPDPVAGHLAADRQVVVVLRLVLDPQARLRRGELLDATGVSQGRFVGLNGLVATVLHWLERQQPAGIVTD